MFARNLLSYSIAQRYSGDQIARREGFAANPADFGLSVICHALSEYPVCDA